MQLTKRATQTQAPGTSALESSALKEEEKRGGRQLVGESGEPLARKGLSVAPLPHWEPEPELYWRATRGGEWGTSCP